jgi:hypothetical protein
MLTLTLGILPLLGAVAAVFTAGVALAAAIGGLMDEINRRDQA